MTCPVTAGKGHWAQNSQGNGGASPAGCRVSGGHLGRGAGLPWEARKGGPRCGEEPGGDQRAGLHPPGPSGLELSAPRFQRKVKNAHYVTNALSLSKSLLFSLTGEGTVGLPPSCGSHGACLRAAASAGVGATLTGDSGILGKWWPVHVLDGTASVLE